MFCQNTTANKTNSCILVTDCMTGNDIYFQKVFQITKILFESVCMCIYVYAGTHMYRFEVPVPCVQISLIYEFEKGYSGGRGDVIQTAEATAGGIYRIATGSFLYILSVCLHVYIHIYSVCMNSKYCGFLPIHLSSVL